MELLKKQELLIQPNVLKHSSAGQTSVSVSASLASASESASANVNINQVSYQEKQDHFSSTCFAIECIIKNKLYKLTAQNLEQYFLKEFNVSRAQVYRLLDCAAVLRSLDGMYPLPHKYKICKDLKQKAGLGPDCKSLWQKVIDHAAKSAAITSGASSLKNQAAASSGDDGVKKEMLDYNLIRESDVESFAFDILPNIVKQTRKASITSSPPMHHSSTNSDNYYMTENKENSPSNSNPLHLKRKLSESSLHSSSSMSHYHHHPQQPHSSQHLHPHQQYDRRPSFDSYSRRSSIDSLPPSNSNSRSPFIGRRESNDSIRTLVDVGFQNQGYPRFPVEREGRGSIGDLDGHGRPVLPPILPKRRYSEADTRKPTGLRESMYQPAAPLYAHKEEGESSHSNGSTKRAFTFHESRFDKPPAPILKKRVSLPGLSSLHNTSRPSSTQSSPQDLPSKSYSFAANYSAPSDPLYQHAKSRSARDRDWQVYAHQIAAHSTNPSTHPPPSRPSNMREEEAIVSEFVKCQDALTRLSARGYQLTPMVQGKWLLEPITQWRIVSSSELENRVLTVPAVAVTNPKEERKEVEEEVGVVENADCDGSRERRRSVLDDLVDAAAMSVPVLDDTLPDGKREEMMVDDVGVNQVPAAPTQVVV